MCLPYILGCNTFELDHMKTFIMADAYCKDMADSSIHCLPGRVLQSKSERIMRKCVLSACTNSKSPDQPAYPGSLIGVFTTCLLPAQSLKPVVNINKWQTSWTNSKCRDWTRLLRFAYAPKSLSFMGMYFLCSSLFHFVKIQFGHHLHIFP